MIYNAKPVELQLINSVVIDDIYILRASGEMSPFGYHIRNEAVHDVGLIRRIMTKYWASHITLYTEEYP